MSIMKEETYRLNRVSKGALSALKHGECSTMGAQLGVKGLSCVRSLIHDPLVDPSRRGESGNNSAHKYGPRTTAQLGPVTSRGSGLNLVAGVEGSSPAIQEEKKGWSPSGQLRCACSPLCEGKDHCSTTGRCYVRRGDPSSVELVRGCLHEYKSKCALDTGQHPTEFHCCVGDMCNLKLTAPSVRLPGTGSGSQGDATAVDQPRGGGQLNDMRDYSVLRRYKCTCDPLCNGKDHCYTEGKCYVKQHAGSSEIVRDCFKDQDQSYMNCMSSANVGYFRCCQGDLCNQNLTVRSLLALEDGSSPQADGTLGGPDKGLIIAMAVTVCVAALLVATVVALVVRRRCRLRQKELGLRQQAASCKLLEADSLWKEDFGDQMSSGSGRGQPHLVKQTVGKQVTMDKLIGKGRFGEVWRGTWRGEDVAVKTFSSREETSYKQESEIYNTILLRHDNILGFCAADTIGINSTTQHLLIMHYHRNGSLYDYLQSSDIDVEDMLILAHSAAAGLSHLHEEILEGGGRRVKPSIAHRDIKSKNILVKDNGQCCIGDLGHAIRNDKLDEAEVKTKPSTKSASKLWCFKESDTADSNDSLPSDTESKTAPEPVKLLVGTKRYMAPEVLNGDLNPAFFESFKRVDVYAFGLVLWEIAKRARPYADVYHPPFWDVVPHDPTLEDMKKVVVDEGQRPPIPNQWTNDPVRMCSCSIFFTSPPPRPTPPPVHKIFIVNLGLESNLLIPSVDESMMIKFFSQVKGYQAFELRLYCIVDYSSK
ncbi:receptor protein serine/threonine kinase [Plakobranchus ocellatus]|uniref:receptor protein serine/threonine kinase n=1 Tax=Plakobranchus ocellatus TaxID=259542 RepID=A0AAV4BPQ1_9GAST|nr:receptor protein serine/threonine kinase [Plakobranchus ocellatus]